MKKNIIFFLFITFYIHIETGCKKNIIADEASYIEINEFNYSGNDNSTIPHTNGYENYHSVNISDVWISMNGQILGTFEIPCTIPVLTEGTHSLDIYPGIKVNGISAERIKYPFYNKFETEITLEKNNNTKVNPITSYSDATLFEFEEQGQFEIAGTMFEKSIMSDTVAIIQNEIVFQGENSVGIYLDSINTYFDIRNIEQLKLEDNTFLELNFKSNINFNVGLIILNGNNIEQKEELIQLYSTESWKKIYLDFSPLINMGNSLSMFKIYFEGYHDNGKATSRVYLDNLKLVFRK